MKTKQFESVEKNVLSVLLPQKEIDVDVTHMGNQKCTKTMQDKVQSTFRWWDNYCQRAWQTLREPIELSPDRMFRETFDLCSPRPG